MWSKVRLFIEKYSIAIIAALTTLGTVIIGILVMSKPGGIGGSSKEELIDKHKEIVDDKLDTLEDQEEELVDKDEELVDDIKDIKETLKKRKEVLQDDIEKIDDADSFDELLAIQRELCSRARNR